MLLYIARCVDLCVGGCLISVSNANDIALITGYPICSPVVKEIKTFRHQEPIILCGIARKRSIDIYLPSSKHGYQFMLKTIRIYSLRLGTWVLISVFVHSYGINNALCCKATFVNSRVWVKSIM